MGLFDDIFGGSDIPGPSQDLLDLTNQLPGASDQNVASITQGFNFLEDNFSQALDVLNQNAQQALGFQQPFIDGGLQGFNLFSNNVLNGGFDPGEFNFQFDENDPGFQFLKEQGNSAINAGANAAGLLNSGGRFKELSRFNQGLANTFKTDELNRQLGVFGANQGRLNNLFNQQNTLSNFGFSGSNNASNIFSNLGANQANTLTGLGSQGANIFGNIGEAGFNGLISQIEALSGIEDIGRNTDIANDQNDSNSIGNIIGAAGTLFGIPGIGGLF